MLFLAIALEASMELNTNNGLRHSKRIKKTDIFKNIVEKTDMYIKVLFEALLLREI
jgi:hypothetical protein